MLAILVAGMVTTALALLVIHRIWRLSSLEDSASSSAESSEGSGDAMD